MVQPLRRFFVAPGALRARNVTLGPELAHRLSRVLRLKRGDHVILSAGGPKDHEVQFTALSPHAATAVVIAERQPPPEPHVKLVLYQSLIRANRFDLALEKGTEIGVSRFVPIVTARSLIQPEDEPSMARAERWKRIIVEAAEQCHRGRLPEIEGPMSFEDALRQASGLKLLPWEEERRQRLGAYLRSLPSRPETVSLFIGPEGGFENSEVEMARGGGAVPVSLGQRVLRSETAGIVASAIVLEALEAT